MANQTVTEFEKKCRQCSEVELYVTINSLGGFIWQMNHDLADGRIPESSDINESLAEAQRKIEFAVEQTKRFGVIQPRSKQGGPTYEYRRWFQWWDSYVNGLSFTACGTLERAINKGEDVSSWRPEGDWRKQTVTNEN